MSKVKNLDADMKAQTKRKTRKENQTKKNRTASIKPKLKRKTKQKHQKPNNEIKYDNDTENSMQIRTQ